MNSSLQSSLWGADVRALHELEVSSCLSPAVLHVSVLDGCIYLYRAPSRFCFMFACLLAFWFGIYRERIKFLQ